jgi:hypothetical protein
LKKREETKISNPNKHKKNSLKLKAVCFAI